MQERKNIVESIKKRFLRFNFNFNLLSEWNKHHKMDAFGATPLFEHYVGLFERRIWELYGLPVVGRFLIGISKKSVENLFPDFSIWFSLQSIPKINYYNTIYDMQRRQFCEYSFHTFRFKENIHVLKMVACESILSIQQGTQRQLK